jgi:hypothetical protein
MHIHLVIAVTLSLLLFVVPAFAAHPLITDDAGTQGRGKWQVELDSQYEHEHEHGARANDTEISPIVTYGLTETTDVIVGSPYHILREQEDGPTMRERGFTDTSIEVKWRFHEKDGVSFAFKPGITLPTGDDKRGLGAGRVTYKLFFITTVDRETWAFHLNLGYLRTENTQNARTDIWHASLASEYRPSTRLRVVANIGMERGDDPASRSNPAFLLGGLIYSLTDRLDIDGGYKYGLTRSETESAILFGVTFRF